MAHVPDLGRDSVGKLLFRLALPAILAQVVNVLYNIVDRIFIGRIPNGELAMAGIGIAFPILMIVFAFSVLIGMGGAPLVAIKLGEGNKKGAEKIVSNSFTLLLLFGVILTIGVLLFKEPLLYAFGASEQTIGFGKDYLGIYSLGTIFVMITMGMNAFINAQGFSRISMYTVMIGAIINIILDPIFIFGLDLGVKGAAIATVCGQLASALWVLFFLFGKKSIIKIRKAFLVPDIKIVLSIMALGVSPFIMNSTECLVLFAFNNELQTYGGDLAIGAMTIMGSIMQMILLPLNGLNQGALPILGYNLGAKNYDRVRKTFRIVLTWCLGVSVVFWAALMLKPEFFVGIFNKNPELVEMTSWSIRIYFAGVFMFGAQIACQQTFIALGNAKASVMMAILRKIILLVPFIYIVPLFCKDKLFGVLLAEPLADIIAATVTIITFTIFYRKHLSNQEGKTKAA